MSCLTFGLTLTPTVSFTSENRVAPVNADVVVELPARKLTFSVTAGSPCRRDRLNVCGLMTLPETVKEVVGPSATAASNDLTSRATAAVPDKRADCADFLPTRFFYRPSL